MNPILFLDFDGVLNSAASLKIHKKSPLAPEHIAVLNRITDQSHAHIVVSSSWRYGTSVPQLRRLLKRKGVTAPIVGKTPELRNETFDTLIPRGREIQAWLDTHPHERFAILDDGSDMEHLSPYLVQTDYRTGLTDAHIDPTLALLLP